MNTLFEWCLLELLILWLIHRDYRKKESALLKAIWQKYKGDKSDKWKIEYDQEKVKLSDSFIGKLVWIFLFTLLFAMAHIVDLITWHFHIKWIGDLVRMITTE